jgi:putative hemolysin
MTPKGIPIVVQKRPGKNEPSLATPSQEADISAPGQGDGSSLADKPYEPKRLSYATTFTDPVQQTIIQVMEFLTAKPALLRRIRKFEAMGVPHGQPFWSQALSVMGIEVQTPDEQIAKIPRTGPLVVTANHPHGLVDGMVMGELIGRVRTDYKILTRSLLTGVAEIDGFMVPVPFAHDPDALRKNIEMRRLAMRHLADGGVIALFPSGVVASADRMMGPAIEREWSAFTAKMIQRSGATVVPLRFTGQNSRAYQIASRLSPTLRQGLLLHEVRHALDKVQSPIVGDPISPEEMTAWVGDPMGFMRWLREKTLALH